MKLKRIFITLFLLRDIRFNLKTKNIKKIQQCCIEALKKRNSLIEAFNIDTKVEVSFEEPKSISSRISKISS